MLPVPKINLASCTETWEALGTTWTLELPTESDSAITLGVRACLETFEQKYSRFRPTSEVSVLNQTKRILNPSTTLVDMLRYGVTLYQYSNERFNILTGHIQDARGYNANLTFQAGPGTEPDSLPNPTHDLHIRGSQIELRAGSVDLGGFGKGYAIDVVHQYIQQNFQLPWYLINGGGDIFVHNTTREPIAVYLQHPTRPNVYTHRLPDLRGALAVSSPYQRFWQTKNTNQTYSHLIEPDAESESSPSCAVRAPTACEADALATIYYLLRAESITSSLLPRRPYLLVYPDGTCRRHPQFGATVLA